MRLKYLQASFVIKGSNQLRMKSCPKQHYRKYTFHLHCGHKHLRNHLNSSWLGITKTSQ